MQIINIVLSAIIIQLYFQEIISQAPPLPAAAKTPPKPKGNGTAKGKPKVEIDLKTIQVDSFICSKKKIFLELSKGGLGNKLWGVLSGTMLALALHRTLEVDWPDDIRQLRGVFEDYFVSPVVPRGESFNLTKRYDPQEHKEVVYPHTRCNLDMTIGKKGSSQNGDTAWILKNGNLLKKLDASCDTIRIKSNFDLSKLITDPDHGEFATKLMSHFPMPVHTIFKKGFLEPQPYYKDRVDAFKVENGLVPPTKFVSLHSRGLFDGDGMFTKVALECAKSMLEKKLVDKVFFASDQSRMLRMAKDAIPPGKLVAYENKTMVLSIREMNQMGMLANLTAPPKDPSYLIRNESDVAFFEWLVLSESTYCLTPTVSTFSMTSILRSDCFYIDSMKGADCANGVTAPLPRTVEPNLFQRYLQLERYFAVNKTCDAACEAIAWKNIKIVDVPATNSTTAARKRELCAVFPDITAQIKSYYDKTW